MSKKRKCSGKVEKFQGFEKVILGDKQKKTDLFKDKDQIDIVIDLDMEADNPFSNSKGLSNSVSSKQWACIFSKGNEKSIDSNKNVKGQRKKKISSSNLKNSSLKVSNKVTKIKDNASFSSPEKSGKQACERLFNLSSPQKGSPIKGKSDFQSSSLAENSTTDNQPILTTVSMGVSNDVCKVRPSLSNLTDFIEENTSISNIDNNSLTPNSSNGENFSPESSICFSNSKIVDVIVCDSDPEDLLTDNFIVCDNDSDDLLDSNVVVYHDSQKEGTLEDSLKGESEPISLSSEQDQDLAGGFLRFDNDSEEESSSSEKSRLDQTVCSKVISTDKLGAQISSPKSMDRFTDSSKHEPLPSSQASTKQTSLLSFFTSKFSSWTSNHAKPKHVSAINEKTSHPNLAKSQTFPPANSSKGNWVKNRASSQESQSTAGTKTGKPIRQCPFYKKIPGTNISVDAFRYGVIPGCNVYFLTHFHYDHYGGLTKKFAQPIYCSEVTGNLVEKRLGVDSRWIHRLPMWTPIVVDGVTLTLMEANHCPGAVIVLFETTSGKKILHTGDFRASPDMEHYPALKNVVLDELYLDTTYCNPSYAFPSQKTVIDFAVSLVRKQIALNPKILIVCGAYTIGKERIFSAIAKELDSKICVMSDKKKVLDCLDDADLKKRLTLNWSEGQVHVLPMAKLKQQTLFEHHARHPRFTSVLAFEPTGWTHSDKAVSIENIRPKWSRNGVTLYGVPYSEHSSYLELKRFVQFTVPKKILPTVNNGNADTRKKMENIFELWRHEKSHLDNSLKTSQQSKLDDWMVDEY